MLAKLKVFRRLVRLAGRRKGRIALGVACVPLFAGLQLWMPRVIGGAIDVVRAPAEIPDPTAALWAACLLLAAIGGAEATLRFAARRSLIDASRGIEADLKDDRMAHLQRLPASWFDRARTGDLIARFTQDVELLRFLVGPILLHGGSALVVVPGGIWLMTSLSPLLTAAASVAFALLLGSLLWLSPRLRRNSKAVQESIARISQRCSEDFAGIRVLMAFARGRAETAAMHRLGEDYVHHNMQLTRLRALVNLFVHATRDLVVLAVIVVGALEAAAGRLTLGELFQFLMLMAVMLWPLIVSGWVISMLSRAHAAAERIEEVFAAAPEAAGGARPDLRGHLVVRELTFTYPGAPRPAVDDVSFELRPGQRLGLVGPIGSGKSTLLALLLRLYEPPRGTVFLDGHDVLDLDPAALRAAFAVAPQDPFLFSDTVAGNVGFGADEEIDLDAPVRMASLDLDLEQLPAGVETVVGERGVTLSGGQKQRVSLARALAADRPALVLDDTLSAVDHRTEARILGALREDGRGERTALIAAHRLSAVVDADLILVLDAGRIVARGSHAELIARPGFYADTWRRQREQSALEGDGA